MPFDSPVYVIFVVPLVIAYWNMKHRSQNLLLLAASYFFYGWWDYRFLALMIVSTAIDYYIGNKVKPVLLNSSHRRQWLLLSIFINLTILGIFKYFNFFMESFSAVLLSMGVQHVPTALIRILLPPGISFYTFQELAYIIDVYNGKLEPSRSFVEYSLFISLFPHLIAGPIQRPGHLLPQVQQNRRFDADKAFDGVLLILSGLMRKCIVADNCALLANAAFGGSFGQPNLWVVLIGSYAFAWQIYGDFSGYSDIARGSAQLLGFHFMVNFRQPYLADRLQDFWRRWHISLSTWLRDYLYIPLGGSAQVLSTYRNLLATMILGGLWHGANWTFLVWGGIHGICLAAERCFLGSRPSTMKPDINTRQNELVLWIRRIVLFHGICFTWIIFRATSLRSAMRFIAGITKAAWRPEYGSAFIMLAIFSLPLFVADLFLESTGGEYPFSTSSYRARTTFSFVAVILLVMLSANNMSAFIYFRF